MIFSGIPHYQAMPDNQSVVSSTMKDLTVELSTPAGCVFTAFASSIDLQTQAGSIRITSGEESHLNMVHVTEITLQTAKGPYGFTLENAVAGLNGTRFTVLAEHIHRIKL